MKNTNKVIKIKLYNQNVWSLWYEPFKYSKCRPLRPYFPQREKEMMMMECRSLINAAL